MKFGFEREFFVYKKGAISLVPKDAGLPMDECGYLVESRSEAHSDPIKAAFLLLAEEYRMTQQVSKAGLKMVLKPFEIITKEFERAALRVYGKGVSSHERGNLWGLDFPITDDIVARAGLHIHFSNPVEIRNEQGKVIYSGSGMFDMIKIIQTLDKAFEKEIADARRIKGCYEMKPHAHGGFEYRSLPADVDVRKIAEVLLTIR